MAKTAITKPVARALAKRTARYAEASLEKMKTFSMRKARFLATLRKAAH